MFSQTTIFWEVDAQVDFMLPGGRLYVPGAEKIIPNLNRLVDVARQGRVLLISSADAHSADDPELREWPPHCLKGTPGAELLPEACTTRRLIIPNTKEFAFPENLEAYKQVTLEKNTLDVFDNPNTDTLLRRLTAKGWTSFDLNPEFVVFGVATDYCVHLTAEGLLHRGHRVAIVTDAIRSINEEKGQNLLRELQSQGVRILTTERALASVGRSLALSA